MEFQRQDGFFLRQIAEKLLRRRAGIAALGGEQFDHDRLDLGGGECGNRGGQKHRQQSR